MKKIIYCFLFLGFCSCEHENFLSEQNTAEQTEDVKQKVFVWKERNPNLPRIWAKEVGLTTRGTFTTATDFLGSSYAVRDGNSVMGDFSNIKFPIIDVAKVRQQYATAIVGKELRETSVSSFAYSDFDRFEKSSHYSKKVSSGFSIDLGLFKIGRKKTINKIFTNHFYHTGRTVYGELNIEVKHGELALQTSPYILGKIGMEYLHPLFLETLYNTPMKDIIDSYGDFIVTRYTVGGRASAMFIGNTKKVCNSEYREKVLNLSMGATVPLKIGTNDTAAVNIGVGKHKVDSMIKEVELNDIYFVLKTFGGDYGYNAYTSPSSAVSTKIDLTEWMKSLNNVNLHTMTDVQDGGLFPLSAILPEENFRIRFDDTYQGFQTSTELGEPYIQIMKVYVRKNAAGQKLYGIAPVLKTRFGDNLILWNSDVSKLSDEVLLKNSTESVFNQQAESLAKEMAKYFDLEIRISPTATINPILRTQMPFEIKFMHPSLMKKYYHAATGMTYVYCMRNKICFSFLDDYVLDAYGIREWVDALPVRPMLLNTFRQRYKIYGL